VAETFLPLQRDIPGFVSYYFVDVGEAGARMVSASVFEREEGTAESNRRAVAWVADHSNLIPPARLPKRAPSSAADRRFKPANQ